MLVRLNQTTRRKGEFLRFGPCNQLPLDDSNPQLKRGLEAEHRFLISYSRWIERNNGQSSRNANWSAVDFTVRGTGRGVELKTDFYPHPKNIFLERWVTEERRASGGPWKAREQEADFFCYWLVGQSRLLIFDTNELIEHVESLPSWKRREAKTSAALNSGYRSVGYLVKIEDVDYVALDVHHLEFRE